MSSQFNLPRAVKLSPSGNPYSGAQATFYQTRTDVLQTVYQDAAKTTPHASSINADDDGYFPPIWLDESAAFDYRVKIVSANGVMLDDVNDIQRAPFTLTSVGIGATLDSLKRTAAEIAASVTPLNYAYSPLNPWRYGADGSGGIADVTALTAVQSVLAQSTSIDEWANGLAATGYVQTAAERAAGVAIKNWLSPPLDVRRYGYKADNDPNSATANTAALNAAILVVATTLNGATGDTVSIPQGVGYINATINLPNRVRIKGVNCSGSILRAHTTFSTPTVPFMFYASNGIISMFDSILEDFTIDCNNVAALGGVKSIAWQENSGLRNVLVYQFTTDGFYYTNAWGGASSLELKQVQFFPSNLGATSCIRIDLLPTTASGAFLLHVRDSVMAGNIQGTILTTTSLVGGSSYTTGTYTDVALTGGSGTQAHATIVAAGGAVTSVTITAFGSFPGGADYVAGDTLSALAANIGGTGSGFSIRVGTIAHAVTAGINIGGSSLLLQNSHLEGCVNGVVADTSGAVTLMNVTGIAGMTSLVNLISTFTGFLKMIGCRRNGSGMNLVKNDVTGETIVSPDVGDYTYPEIRCANTAKAWCMFNGTTAGTNAPTAGFNVTSVQRTGAGRYKVTVTNNANSANMAMIASSNLTTSGAREWTQVVNASSFNIGIDVAGVATDASEVKVVAFGP